MTRDAMAGLQRAQYLNQPPDQPDAASIAQLFAELMRRHPHLAQAYRFARTPTPGMQAAMHQVMRPVNYVNALLDPYYSKFANPATEGASRWVGGLRAGPSGFMRPNAGDKWIASLIVPQHSVGAAGQVAMAGLGALMPEGEAAEGLELGTGEEPPPPPPPGAPTSEQLSRPTGVLQHPTESLAPHRPIRSVPRASVAGQALHGVYTDDPGATINQIRQEGMRAGWFAKPYEQETLDAYLQSLQQGGSRIVGWEGGPIFGRPDDIPQERVLMVDPKDLPPEIPGDAATRDDYIPQWSPSQSQWRPYLGSREFGNVPPEAGQVVPETKITELVGPDRTNPNNVLVRDMWGQHGTNFLTPSEPTGPLPGLFGDRPTLPLGWTTGIRSGSISDIPVTEPFLAPTGELKAPTGDLREGMGPQELPGLPPSMYHGTHTPVGRFVNDVYNPANLYSPYGVFQTSDLGVSRGYAGLTPEDIAAGPNLLGGSKLQGRVYASPLKSTEEAGLLDLEQRPMHPEIRRHILEQGFSPQASDADYIGAEIADRDRNMSLRQWMDTLRDEAPYNQDQVDVLDSIHEHARRLGYRGYRHLGGVKTGGPLHEVHITFDPENLGLKPVFRGPAQPTSLLPGGTSRPSRVTGPLTTQDKVKIGLQDYYYEDE